MTVRLTAPKFGLDMTGPISVGALHTVRATFVVRYLSRFTPKAISHAEADTYRAAGIGIALVFEDDATRPLLGYEAGKEDAQYGIKQAAAAGLGNARFFSAFDTDPAGHPADATDAYYDGMRAVMGSENCGPYGGKSLISRQADRGFGQMLFQTAAWSGGQIDTRARIHQFGISVAGHNLFVGGVNVDYNHAWYQDYGQHGFVSPLPIDTSGYSKFDKTMRRLNNGRTAAELSTVMEYDKYRRLQTHVRHPHRPELAVLRSDCLELARRIASVAREPGSGGYGPNHREWRYKQLIARCRGQLVVH